MLLILKCYKNLLSKGVNILLGQPVVLSKSTCLATLVQSFFFLCLCYQVNTIQDLYILSTTLAWNLSLLNWLAISLMLLDYINTNPNSLLQWKTKPMPNCILFLIFQTCSPQINVSVITVRSNILRFFDLHTDMLPVSNMVNLQQNYNYNWWNAALFVLLSTEKSKQNQQTIW